MVFSRIFYKQIKEHINKTKNCVLKTTEEEFLTEWKKGIVPTKVKLEIQVNFDL